MKSQRRMIGLVVPLAVLAGAVVVSDLLGAAPTPVPAASGGAAGARRLAPGSVRSAEDEGPAPGSRMKYRLPHQALLGLPTGIQLQQLTKRFGAGQGPTGIQYFQSPSGLFGMSLQRGDGLLAAPLLFLTRGEWRFLADQRFQQVDPMGNRLLLGNGKAQVFNSAGLQIGALEDPALVPLYGALLKLTM